MKVNRGGTINNNLEPNEVQKELVPNKNTNLGIANAKDGFESAKTRTSNIDVATKTIQPQDTANVITAHTFGAEAGMVVGAIVGSGATIGQAASSDGVSQAGSNQDSDTTRTIKKKD